MRAAAHLGAQGRLVRGFADKCEESLFKEPLADNKEWLLLHQRHVAHDPPIDEDDDPDGHAASERTVLLMKLDEVKCEAQFEHLTKESSTLPLAMLIADLTEMKTVEHELRTPGSMQEISHALAAFWAEEPVYGIAELAHGTEMEEAWKVLNQCVHDVLKYSAYKKAALSQCYTETMARPILKYDEEHPELISLSANPIIRPLFPALGLNRGIQEEMARILTPPAPLKSTEVRRTSAEDREMAVLPKFTDRTAKVNMVMQLKTILTMPERHLTIQALMRAVEQCEELKTKWYTYMSQKSGDATYVAKSDKDKVIDFVTMLLKEIDKPMAVAEALAKLEDVEHKDGQRVQEFFNAYAAASQTYLAACAAANEPLRTKYAGDRGKTEAAIDRLNDMMSEKLASHLAHLNKKQHELGYDLTEVRDLR